MADRAAREALIREVYASRVRGDVDAIMARMSEDVGFCIAGCGSASPVPLAVEGAAAVRTALSGLTGAFTFKDARITSLLIDGDEAAVHLRVRVVASATGREDETELLDLVRFDGDKIVSYKQFCDTALAARLLQPA